MRTPLALAAALLLLPTTAPAADLELTNVRNTYGELGGTRPDAKLLPGDVLFVGFDIENLTVADDGKVQYTMALELKDAAGKSVFKQEPAAKDDFVPLGGTKLPARAFITAGLDQPAGEYTLTLTVADKAKPGAAKTLTRAFEILKPDFGVIGVYASVDDQGTVPAPTTGIVGQTVFVQLGVVGFQRDPKDKQPKVDVEMSPLDEAGKPTIVKPTVFSVAAGVEEQRQGLLFHFPLPLSRVGKYTIRLKATDNVSKKTATFDLPVAVVPSAN